MYRNLILRPPTKLQVRYNKLQDTRFKYYNTVSNKKWPKISERE